MRITASAFLLLVAAGLVACSLVPSDRTVVYSENFEEENNGRDSDWLNIEARAPEFSMLEVGRALSDGAVDIFDPWLPTLTVPAPERAETDTLASFMIHPHMLVRDHSVRVYEIPENPSVEIEDLSLPLDLVTDTATSPNAPSLPEVESEPLELVP